MAKRKQAKAAMPYLQRMAENEYAQQQLRNAAARLREAYSRGTKQGTKTAEDKKFYGKVREAATSIRRAVGAVEDPPPKPKRRGRKAVAIALIGAAAVIAGRARKAKQPDSYGNDGEPAAFDAFDARDEASAEPIGAASGA
jgi:Tfp pilus assembly protein PilE